MWGGEAVAAHGGGRAVEDGRFGRVEVGEGPVPVWLGAGVVALGAESALVEPEEVAVEMEEYALVNDSVSKSDNSGVEVWRCLRRSEHMGFG